MGHPGTGGAREDRLAVGVLGDDVRVVRPARAAVVDLHASRTHVSLHAADDGRCLLRLEHWYDHPVRRVWQALIDSAAHSRCFGVRIEIEPVLGGAVRFWFSQQPEVGRVLGVQAPRLLVHTDPLVAHYATVLRPRLRRLNTYETGSLNDLSAIAHWGSSACRQDVGDILLMLFSRCSHAQAGAWSSHATPAPSEVPEMSTTTMDRLSTPLSVDRVGRAKLAYTTRHVDVGAAVAMVNEGRPRVGDLVLARVMEVGQHTRIERRDGRRAHLFVGDEVVVAYGNRYAPDQFEAVVPEDLGICQLVAAGGIAARVVAAHGKMADATSLAPVGLLVDAAGRRLNLSAAAPPPAGVGLGWMPDRPVIVAVLGASMNSGKTTAAASVVRGLRAAGLRVGAAKVTGTGAGGDVWLLQDSGADPVYDFTCAGVPSTYRVGAQQVRRIFVDLTDRLAEAGCEVVVIEVADGVYQQETAQLVQDDVFAARVDAVLFAATDALGACAGHDWLRRRGIEVLALSGVLSASPLATREAEAATGVQVWGLEQLTDPVAVGAVYEDLLAGRPVRGTRAAPEPDPAVEVEMARPRLTAAV